MLYLSTSCSTVLHVIPKSPVMVTIIFNHGYGHGSWHGVREYALNILKCERMITY